MVFNYKLWIKKKKCELYLVMWAENILKKREYSHGDYKLLPERLFSRKILENIFKRKFSKNDYYRNFYRIPSIFENTLQKDYRRNFTSLLHLYLSNSIYLTIHSQFEKQIWYFYCSRSRIATGNYNSIMLYWRDDVRVMAYK